MFRISRQVLPDAPSDRSGNLEKIFTNESMNEPKNFRVFSKLGSGRHGSVHMAYHIVSSNKYAIKYKDREVSENKHENNLQREIDILKILDHENIINFRSSFQIENCDFLVIDYMDGGDLLDDLHKKGRYTEHRAQQVSIQIVRALKHCHDKRIVHRDVKPENILLDNKGNVKLADFSLSTRLPESSECSLISKCGTRTYLAPEVISGCGYGTPVDMWGIGIVIFIMIGGYHPFEASNLDKSNALIIGGLYSFHQKYWDDVTKDTKSIISGMLTVNPDKRISAGDALGLSWLHLEQNVKPSSSSCCGWGQ